MLDINIFDLILSIIGVINIFMMSLLKISINIGVVRASIIKNIDVFINNAPMYFKSLVDIISIMNIRSVKTINIRL